MKTSLALVLAVIPAMASDPARGMPRFRWESFTTSSGLPSDRVFNVCMDGDRLWAATGNGLAAYRNGERTVYTPFVNYTQLNSVLPNDVAYGIAVRGAGVVGCDTKSGPWIGYSDPDEEAEVVVSKDRDPIHDIATPVSWLEAERVLWVATYFGANRSDGGKRTVYRSSPDTHEPEISMCEESDNLSRAPAETAPAHNHGCGVGSRNDDIWVATAKGLRHGIRIP